VNRTISARQTCFCAALRSLMRAWSRRRSAGETEMDFPVRIAQTRTRHEKRESQKGLTRQISSTRPHTGGHNSALCAFRREPIAARGRHHRGDHRSRNERGQRRRSSVVQEVNGGLLPDPARVSRAQRASIDRAIRQLNLSPRIRKEVTQTAVCLPYFRDANSLPFPQRFLDI